MKRSPGMKSSHGKKFAENQEVEEEELISIRLFIQLQPILWVLYIGQWWEKQCTMLHVSSARVLFISVINIHPYAAVLLPA